MKRSSDDWSADDEERSSPSADQWRITRKVLGSSGAMSYPPGDRRRPQLYWLEIDQDSD
ncbi:hypothetical protein CGLO_01919 [Colletotrichum gloeosporioides Cg-14]|uniref:Uncharacterized protein n=1 Tax=Colletotrichum gloeosporioides (strain Cg-14) TaxID=1237896 RepID=T0KZ89_COLGC|nr:hypothetical protein CGLO_01919 [Colletotrichum gloeosporioides Cg-14]